MSYTNVVKALDEQRKGGDDGYQPCKQCESPTLRAILAQYGSMCVRCYEGWCREGPCGEGDRSRALSHADKQRVLHDMQSLSRNHSARLAVDPRRWARELQRRENAGEQLSSRAQRAAWREALHREPGVGDPSADADSRLRTAELQEAAARQVAAYIALHPEAATVGLTQEQRDVQQRAIDAEEARERVNRVRTEAFRRAHGVST